MDKIRAKYEISFNDVELTELKMTYEEYINILKNDLANNIILKVIQDEILEFTVKTDEKTGNGTVETEIYIINKEQAEEYSKLKYMFDGKNL